MFGRVHRRVHQEEKPHKCDVEGCDKAFKTPAELSRHAFRHTGEKPHKCDQCDKAFIRYDDLKRHYRIHTGEYQPRQATITKHFNYFLTNSDCGKITRSFSTGHRGVKLDCKFGQFLPYKSSILLEQTFDIRDLMTCNAIL